MNGNITVNNLPIKRFIFSGGECHVNIEHIVIGDITGIKAYLFNSDNIMQLIMTVDAVRRKNPKTLVHLILPYIPYARQDRVCNPGESFGVAAMANLINSLKCESVMIEDPHSEVTARLINKSRVLTQRYLVKDSVVEIEINREHLYLVAPDAGATAKTKELAEAMEVGFVQCTKVRDSATGNIIDTEIPDYHLIDGYNFIIIDDICDGGRTFVEIAKRFNEAGARNLYLYVTHGIFSKGLYDLNKYFKHVYCHNTFLHEEVVKQWDHFITVIGEQ